MKNLLQDLRFALRTMIKRPGFSVVAIITLALGIGASTSIFTVVNAGLVRGLPYRAPNELYHLWESVPQKEFPQREFSYPDYQDYIQNQVCDIAAYTGGGVIMSGRGEAQRLFAPAVTSNFFNVLGVTPIAGRLFLPGEDKPGVPRTVVLTYGLWQRQFGGDKGIVGQAITLDGSSYQVIGVLPPDFQFAMRPADLWRSYQPTETQLTRRFLHGTNLIARLKPGVSLQQAQSALSLTAARIEQQFNDSHAGVAIKFVPLQEQVIGQVKPILMLLLTAVGFVLLIACANVASLLLTRSISRQKEVAIRFALGASRWRVVRQLLTESVVLSIIGGAAGILLARWSVGALVTSLPELQLRALPFLTTSQIDGQVLLFALGLSLLTGVVFGLAPAFHSARPDLNVVLKEGGRGSAIGSGQRLRTAFVMTQIALAVVLLMGAGLMMKSLLRLLHTNIGFNADNVLTMTVVAPAAKSSQDQEQIQFFDQLKDRVRGLPGLSGVGLVDKLPLQGGNTTRFVVEGDPVPPPGKETEANIRVVDENYFQTLGVPLIAGRMFDSRDDAKVPGVVIISKTTAERVFGSRNPIGRRITYSSVQSNPDTVVGVVGDIRIGGLDDSIRPVLYYPFRQSPSAGANLVFRTSGDPLALTGAIRNELRSMEPEAAVFNVNTVSQLISDSPAAFMRRFPGLMITIFAALALVLSAIGIYGVVSYSVSQQTHYIGLRMALGARASDILKLVLKQGLVIACAGIALGLVGAFALMRLLRTLLFEVQTNDPSTYVVVIVALFSVALLACYLPARRATKVDPLVALRYE